MVVVVSVGPWVLGGESCCDVQSRVDGLRRCCCWVCWEGSVVGLKVLVQECDQMLWGLLALTAGTAKGVRWLTVSFAQDAATGDQVSYLKRSPRCMMNVGSWSRNGRRGGVACPTDGKITLSTKDTLDWNTVRWEIAGLLVGTSSTSASIDVPCTTHPTSGLYAPHDPIDSLNKRSQLFGARRIRPIAPCSRG